MFTSLHHTKKSGRETVSCGFLVGRHSYAARDFLGSFNLLLIISEVVPPRFEIKRFIACCLFLSFLPLFFSLVKCSPEKEVEGEEPVSVSAPPGNFPTYPKPIFVLLYLYTVHVFSLDHWLLFFFDCVLYIPFLIHETELFNHQGYQHPHYFFFCVPMVHWSYLVPWFITHCRYPWLLLCEPL